MAKFRKAIKILSSVLAISLIISLPSCSGTPDEIITKDKENIIISDSNYLVLKNHTGPSGVPLGGIGTGYYEIAPDGRITRMCIGNVHKSFVDSPDGMFISVWESSGAAVRLQRDKKNIFNMPGYNDTTYIGRFPVAEISYDQANTGKQPSTKVSLKAWSGLVPQNIKDSSLPVTWFEVTIENMKNEDIEVSTALSWADLIGRGLRDTKNYNKSNFNLDGSSSDWSFMKTPETEASDYSVDNWVGVKQSVKDASSLWPYKWTYQNYNTDFAILAENNEDSSISVLKSYEITKGDDAWAPFLSKGEFDKTSGTVQLSKSKGNPKKVSNASAVAIKTKLKASEKKTVRFMVSWFMPEPSKDKIAEGPKNSYFKNTDYGRYYHNFAKNIDDIIKYAIGKREKILEGTEEWQNMILSSNMPGWLKFKQINSAYTLYTNTVLNKKGNFSTLEGEMGGLGGTMDQKMSSHPVYQKLFTELDNNENQQFANTRGSQGEILHFDLHYYHGISDFDPANSTPPVNHGSMTDNTGAWLIQLLKTYEQTGDKAYIEKNYSIVKESLAFIQKKCPPGTNIPSYSTTYDDAKHPEIFIYSGTIYLAMLRAGEQIANIMNDQEQAQKYKELFAKTLEDVNRLYVEKNGSGYFCIGSDTKFTRLEEDIIFSGQLAGQFMSRYSGWGDVIDLEKSKSSMLKLLTTSVQNAKDYYAPKIYNMVSGQSLDSPGSRCWPFYLDSYTAMCGIQLGYVEDGLKIIEHTQLVHLNKGLTWSQNLWNPAYSTYMTAPVNWFINDVLAGAAINIPKKTLTLGPCTIPGENSLETPLFYPEFWAYLKYSKKDKKVSLEIVKTFSEKNIFFEKLIISPVGVATEKSETVTLDKPFIVKEGAVLDLSKYYDKLSKDNIIPGVLKPVEAYDNFTSEKVANGKGLAAQYYNGEDFSNPVQRRTDETIEFDWSSQKPTSKLASNSYSVRWIGSVLPRYSQQYTFTIETTGKVKVIFDGKTVIEDMNAGNTMRDLTFQANLKNDRLYPIIIEYVNPESVQGKINFLWWSTSQTREIINKYRLYPSFDAMDTIKATDFTEVKGKLKSEGNNIGFIENNNYALYSNISFGDGFEKGSFTVKASSNHKDGATIEIWLDDIDNGRLVGKVHVPYTGGWGNYKAYNIDINHTIKGFHDVYLKFRGGSGYIVNVMDFKFDRID